MVEHKATPKPTHSVPRNAIKICLVHITAIILIEERHRAEAEHVVFTIRIFLVLCANPAVADRGECGDDGFVLFRKNLHDYFSFTIFLRCLYYVISSEVYQKTMGIG